MTMEHSRRDCPHCANGCAHPHQPTDPFGSVEVLQATTGFGLDGTWTRNGGVFAHEMGLEISSDEWRRVRCEFCGMEMMTPLDLIPPMAPMFEDLTYLIWCGTCVHDINHGVRPGRRRR